MGGVGSGRLWHYGAKDTTEDHRSIDVRRWQRDGLLVPGRALGWQWCRNGEVTASIQVRTESNRVILTYRHRSGGGDWKDENYPVQLDWTTCNFGGKRPWFLCPAIGCGRRVAILYGGGIFACRSYYQLVCPSQREPSDHRALRRAQNIRRRLGGTANMMEPFPPKPKGMHWDTCEAESGPLRGRPRIVHGHGAAHWHPARCDVRVGLNLFPKIQDDRVHAGATNPFCDNSFQTKQ